MTFHCNRYITKVGYAHNPMFEKREADPVWDIPDKKNRVTRGTISDISSFFCIYERLSIKY